MWRLIGVIVLVLYVFVYSLCTVAKRADEQSERFMRDQVQ
jgi:hypothetical protein